MLSGRLGLETARVPHADRHGVIGLERGRLYVADGGLRFATVGQPGGLKAGDYEIPFQQVSVILAGPGVALTHDALRLLARHGTGFVAVGEGATRLYASMPFGPDDSALARRQAALWADPKERIRVALRMYDRRLGERLPQRDLNAMRGIEGARAKAMYARLAAQYGVEWRGRRYDRDEPEAADFANQAINHAASAVSAAAMVAVATVGAIPQLGFIHEDSGMSFALDIADLFRDSVVLPVAFACARDAHQGHEEPIERRVRRSVATALRKGRVIPAMIDTIKELLGGNDGGDHA